MHHRPQNLGKKKAEMHKKAKMQKKKQKCKKSKNARSISKFMQKFIAKIQMQKKAENNISKKHAKKAEMQKKAAKKSRCSVHLSKIFK